MSHWLHLGRPLCVWHMLQGGTWGWEDWRKRLCCFCSETALRCQALPLDEVELTDRPLSLGYLKEGWVRRDKGRWAGRPPSLSLSLPAGSLPTSFPTNFLVGLSGAFLGNPLYCKMNKKLKNNRRPLPRGMHPPTPRPQELLCRWHMAESLSHHLPVSVTYLSVSPAGGGISQ